MDDELLLLRRLITLNNQRTEWSQRSKAGKLSPEEILKGQGEIAKINRRLRELYGY